MTLRVIRVVEGEVLRPIAGFGKLEDGLEECRIIGAGLERSHFDLRAFRQFGLGRQHDDTVFHCAFITHGIGQTFSDSA